MVTRGIYFLANDRIRELVIAFLNSLRVFHPDMSVCYIPYNDDCNHIKALSNEYNFSIYSDDSFLRYCDDLSLHFCCDKAMGQFRKLVAWDGPFDQFIIIDCDIIILMNLEFVFPFLEHYDFITSTSNKEVGLQWVWKNSIYSADILNKEQIEFAANMGFIASRKHMITKELISYQLPGALLVRPHMCQMVYDQPFLNYLIVTSGKRYTSFTTLFENGMKNVAAEIWAGEKGGKVHGGTITFSNHEVPISHIHWAGEWQPRDKFDWRIYGLLRRIGFKKEKDKPVLRKFMPYKKLWDYYRYLRKPH